MGKVFVGKLPTQKLVGKGFVGKILARDLVGKGFVGKISLDKLVGKVFVGKAPPIKIVGKGSEFNVKFSGGVLNLPLWGQAQPSPFRGGGAGARAKFESAPPDLHGRVGLRP